MGTLTPRRAGGARVLFVVPTLTLGGAERHTVELRDRLRRRGFHTTLMVHGPLWSDAMLGFPGAEEPQRLNLRGMSDPIGWIRSWVGISRADADVVVAVNQTPLIVAAVLRRLGATRARLVCVFHTTTLMPFEQGRFFLFRWALRISDALVCVSVNQARTWLARGLRAPIVLAIPNGIDLEAFRPMEAGREATRRRCGFDADDLVLGLVAAFRPEKNHAELLDAVAVLRARGVPAKVLFVGAGPTRPAVEARAGELGLSGALVFAGEQADVRPWIAACDVGVLCSTSETFPLSALEFLAMGRPMVVPDVGGTSEVVVDGLNGALYAPGRTDELVERLAALADPAARATLAARARASVETFSIDTMVDRYQELLERLLEGSGTEPPSAPPP